jgi:hypothetical protein
VGSSKYAYFSLWTGRVLQQNHFIVTAVDLAASSSGLRGRRRTYRTFFKLADHALCKMVRHVLLRPLRPELLAAKSTAVTIKWSRRDVTSVLGL